MRRDDPTKDAIQYWGEHGLVHAGNCLACSNQKVSTAHEQLDDLLGKIPGEWKFLNCEECGSLTLDPMPHPGMIGKAYPKDYVTHSSDPKPLSKDNGTGIIWSACNGYLNKRFGTHRTPYSIPLGRAISLFPPISLQLDYFSRHLPRGSGRILDVGCGNAAFLLRARDSGWEVVGIEPDPDAVAAARQNGIEAIHTTIMEFEANQEFDHVTLSHVLEHLYDPSESLSRIIGWLKPRGRIWLALPNPEGLGHRIFGRNWFSLDPPRHLCIPTQDQVRRMLEDAGYINVQILRRGRGSRNSISPSIAYSRYRTGRVPFFSKIIPMLVDVLSSIHPSFAEETVVIGYRPG